MNLRVNWFTTMVIKKYFLYLVIMQPLNRRLDDITTRARHARFAQEFVKDLDPYRAALRAGYMSTGMSVDAIKTIGQQLLKRESVQQLIKLENDRIQSRNDGMIDKVIDELSRIAFFDIRQVYNADGTIKNVSDFSDDTAGAIIGIDTVNVSKDISVVKVRANDKIKALEMIGKIMGAIRPDVKVTMNGTMQPLNGEPSKHTVVFVNNAKNESIEDIDHTEG